jgi:glycine cleavage system H protein
MSVPDNLTYTKSHEWIKFLSGGIVEIGLTDHAQSELGDIVFVNLPQPGAVLTAGESFADVESVKAVSDIYSPVNGTVKELNEAVLSAPESINASPYEAWLIRAEGEVPAGGRSSPSELLSAADYKALIG